MDLRILLWISFGISGSGVLGYVDVVSVTVCELSWFIGMDSVCGWLDSECGWALSRFGQSQANSVLVLISDAAADRSVL